MSYDEYRELSLCDGYLEDDNLWFSNNSFNALCRLNLKSIKIDVIDTFSRRKKWEKKIHRKIIEHNNFFYLIPNFGNEIDIYNRITGEQSFAKIPEQYLQNNGYFVADALAANDCIWIFPWNSHQSVIVYNILENQFYQDIILTHKLKEFTGTILTYKSVCLDKDWFWMPILYSNCIISYNWKSKEIREFRVNLDNLYSIYKMNRNIWLGTWDTEIIYIWNYETNQLKKIGQGIGKNSNPYFNPIVIKNEVYILSKSEEIIHFTDKGAEKIRIECNGVKINTNLPYIFTCIYNNKLFLLPYQMKYMIWVDLSNKYAKALEFKMSESFVLSNYYKDYKLPFLRDELKKEVIFEDRDFSLDELKKILELKKETANVKKHSNAGESILVFSCSELLR